MMARLSRWFRRRPQLEPPWIEISELERYVADGDALLLVDVRQPEEYGSAPGHLPGAVNIPLADVACRAVSLADLNRQIVVICKTDRRSAMAASTLIDAGIKKVAVLRGGTDAWHRQGLPLQ